MVESEPLFPFYKLRFKKYLVIEILSHLDHPIALQFMHSVCRSARSFLVKNHRMILNGFHNEGLITSIIDLNFDGFRRLEDLYNKMFERNEENRNMKLKVKILNMKELRLVDSVVKWIRDQKKHIEIQMEAELDVFVEENIS